jgi:hypothetical protein
MPRDEWARENRRLISRKAPYERATGKSNFLFLGDELKPLDRMRVELP